MSDSEASISLPSNSKIEQSLRKVIERIFKSGDHDNLTLKRVRKATEDDLKLPDDFFRTNDGWKEKSKVFITSEVVRVESYSALFSGSFELINSTGKTR
jgi:hypothetical protein